jgi:decaprenylphospho-beta-D-ribofuranose 2-oxidase
VGDLRCHDRRGGDRVSERLLTGWGRTAPSRARWRAPAVAADVAAALGAAGPRGVIARGLGRSYGDAAQNAGGDVLGMTAMSGIRSIDAAAGTVTADAGASFDALLEVLVPRGWFLPVVPGTRHVTLGGAIASDVHGKNHHGEGTFSRHVRSMALLTGAGERLTLTPGGTPEEFAATAGGMGLTGVLLEATVALTPIETSWIAADLERAGDLDAAMASMAAGDADHRFSVAWIDCLARGRRLGRSVLMRGDHATLDELPAAHRDAPLARPRRRALAAPPLPSGLLRRPAVAAFNELYFRRAPRRERRLVPLDGFFFPLDGVLHWNRVYGVRGFLQYQVVVPFGREDVIRTVIERLNEARTPSFLAVLKRFGAEGGPLSFPMPGWTLAVDVPAGAPALAAVLDGLDELVAGAGGRVYLAKDSRLRPDAVAAMYPRLARWHGVRARLDPGRVMRSDLGRRLGLVT